ncbi:Cupin 1 [Corchorus capsularis]|uniref:Cupin 1 n=1 Tax=Corchorus capsularis TaxID=210143 RepID=A0A1R3I4W7_COCAP|nr:Cupin 1 [Corchorus capsularis]
MAAKAKLCFIILVISVLALYSGCAIAKQDPELKQCTHQCRVQQQYDEQQKEECVRKCEEYHREKKEREAEKEGGGHEPDGYWSEENQTSKKLKECQRQCEKLDRGGERQVCVTRCQQKWGVKDRKDQKGEEYEKHNPYVFEDRHFSTKVQTEHGRVDLLTKFSDKSELLRGIDKFRLAVLVANPNAFVFPNHFDADAIFVVTQGFGTIKLIHEDKRESLNIKKGDVIWIPAGTPIYFINRDNNEKLFIVKLLKPVNIPGQHEVFFDAGGERAKSIFTTFSTEILEAAFKTSGDKLESFFEEQDQGPFANASKEQIEAMSKHEESGGARIWPLPFPLPFGRHDTRGSSFNLFENRRPSQSNHYGQLFEVGPNEFEPLEILDVKVTYANITRGCMSAPFFNSKATKIAIVVEGDEGYFEMACPHVSSKSSKDRRSHDPRSFGREKSGPNYQKISSRLRPDTVFIVPASHPLVTVATGNKNLEILCFEVNIKDNVRYPLAGKGNFVQQFEKEAKELAFNKREEEVDRIFKSQNEEFFFPGPRQHGGRAYE